MKKLIAIVIIALFLGGGAAGVWWKYFHHFDRFAAARELMAKGDLKAAQIELRNVVRDDPSNAEAHFRLGLLQMRTGDPVAAERELSQARDNGFDPRAVLPLLAQSYMAQGKFAELLKDFPVKSMPPDTLPAILVLRGQAEAQLKQDDAAAASFEQAEKLAPQSIDPLLASARLLIGKHNYAAAETKVDRALTLNARSPDALLLKGQLLNLSGKRPEALQALNTVLETTPNMIAARLERANILIADNEDAKAKTDVDAALKLEPRSAGGIYLQAVLAARAKDFTSADQALTRIQSLLPRFPRGYYFQAVVKFNLGPAEQAAAAASKYVANNPLDLDGVKLLARIDLAMQRPLDAEQTLNKAVAAGQADAETLDLLGRSYAQGGKQAQALQAFERAAELAPNDAGILTRLASARLGTGDAGGAARDLEHSLQLKPGAKAAGEALVVASLAAGEVDRADAALRKLDKNKTGAEAFGILTGLVRMAQLDFAGARAALEEVLKERPNSIPARLNLAKVAVLQNQPAEAEQALNEVLKQNPANEQALSGLLSILIADGRLNKAITVVQAARAAAPANNNLTVALSDLYIRDREPKKALELLDKAQKGQLPSPLLLSALIRAQSAAGLVNDAEGSLRKALAIEPRSIQARRALADLLVNANKAPEARQVLRDGLTVMPGNRSLLQGLIGVELKDGGTDAALKLVDELAKNRANSPGILGLRGDVYMAAKRYDDAARAYGDELKQTPDVSLVVRQSSALTAADHPEAALKVLTDWIAAHPDDMQVQLLLATSEIGARQNAEAIKRLELVLSKQPNNVIALNNLAWLYQEAGDKRARVMAQKAYLLAPSPQVSDTLGWVLTAEGEAKTALPLLREAARALPNNMAIQYHLGVALKQTGQKDEAISVLRPIVLGPQQFDDKPEAKRVLDSLTSGG
jgi:putative PEP-CTERM system TPR-repeat lipoprotein